VRKNENLKEELSLREGNQLWVGYQRRREICLFLKMRVCRRDYAKISDENWDWKGKVLNTKSNLAYERQTSSSTINNTWHSSSFDERYVSVR